MIVWKSLGFWICALVLQPEVDGWLMIQRRMGQGIGLAFSYCWISVVRHTTESVLIRFFSSLFIVREFPIQLLFQEKFLFWEIKIFMMLHIFLANFHISSYRNEFSIIIWHEWEKYSKFFLSYCNLMEIWCVQKISNR